MDFSTQELLELRMKHIRKELTLNESSRLLDHFFRCLIIPPEDREIFVDLIEEAQTDNKTVSEDLERLLKRFTKVQ